MTFASAGLGMCLLVIVGNASAWQQVTHGAQSPAIGQGGVVNYVTTYRTSSRLNSLDAKREALLMAENPTVLEIRSVRWNRWFGDHQPFLDVTLVNRSKLPALDVRVELLDLNSAGTLAKLKARLLEKSYTTRIMEGTPINIGNGGTWNLPLASLNDIQKAFPTSHCVTDAGLGFPMQKMVLDPSAVQGSASSRNIAMYLRVKYRTVFKESVSFIQSIVIDASGRAQQLSIDRSSGRLVPLRCVGDPGWNPSIAGQPELSPNAAQEIQ